MNPIITIDETGLMLISFSEEDAGAGIYEKIQHADLEEAQSAVAANWPVRTWVKTTTSDGAEWHPEYKTEAAR